MHRRRNIFLISFAALVLALAPMALAGKGGNGKPTGNTSSSTSLTLSAGPYTFGGTVSAKTTVSADLNPWISMSCSQDGIVVGTATHAAFPGGSYYDTPFNLGPTLSWTGGAADCTFTVLHVTSTKVVTDATASLHVDA